MGKYCKKKMATVPEYFVFVVLVAFSLYKKGYCDKVAGKIYTDLKNVAPCVRLTNATHEIGCTSSMGGHVGVVHLIQSQEDIYWLINHGDHSPYIPLFTSSMFKEKTIKVLLDKQLINGALVIFAGKDGQAPPEGFSPDTDCPNDRYGMYQGNSEYGSCKKVKWNTKGNGMSFMSYGIPIFALYSEREVNNLIKCYNDYNKPVNGSIPDFPLCGVELKDFMFSAKDTPTCMRKSQTPSPTPNQFCDPLGDYNVWGTLYPIMKKPKRGDIVIAAAKLDSSSFFHEMVHGAENDASGVIALLAAAKALGDLKRNGTAPEPARPIMFTLFQGESWDYIGSSRMVYDMDNKMFPPNTWKVDGSEEGLRLDTSDIGYFLELNQVGLGTSLWAHTDPITTANPEVKSKVEQMFQVLENSSKEANISVKNTRTFIDQPLPPSSLQRFLMSNKNISGIVLTDHKENFINKYYNSRFDNAFNVRGNFSKQINSSKIYLHNEFTERLTKVATTLANTLYTLANDGKPLEQPLKADQTTIGHLVYCSFYQTNCDLFKSIFKRSLGEKLPVPPLSRYVSVNTANNTLTLITHNLLLYLTGSHYTSSNYDCSSDKPFVTERMRGNDKESGDICVNGTVYFSVAESPAFVLKQYDSTQYSTWAESTWPADLSVRMFLISSPQSQIVTLASGIVITFFSFIVVVFIHRKAELLFTPVDVPTIPDAGS